ncbi:hypothetical protein [Roseococcus pinisoli]|uniref:Uncharacterized protein n=1 Tax=Roseococcus pinisoli TaxID=2835040 RepID=A0ABS5QH88_9PROT|nr:hypothetical protein [Roseococcus pinisoli]MBS7812315.1 hypothetical protein [Roseococcus pinisoli]
MLAEFTPEGRPTIQPPPPPPKIMTEMPDICVLHFTTINGRHYEVAAHVLPGLDLAGMAEQVKANLDKAAAFDGDRATYNVGPLVVRVDQIESVEARHYAPTA